MKPIRILQLTDPHIFNPITSPKAKQNIQFIQTLSFLKEKKIAFDYIFLTGDLSQDKSVASYEHLAESLSSFNKPIHWTPGAQDDLKRIQTTFSNYALFSNTALFSLKKLKWHFLFCNTLQPKKEIGYLNETTLHQLEGKLADLIEASDACAILMNHHPTFIRMPIIDKHALGNTQAFWTTLSNKPALTKLIICKHVYGYPNTKLKNSPQPLEKQLQWKKNVSMSSIDGMSGFGVWTFGQSGTFNQEIFFF